ncbi:MAG: hypothetical protein AAGJ40_02930 [Planctomycetota bacterium]
MRRDADDGGATIEIVGQMAGLLESGEADEARFAAQACLPREHLCTTAIDSCATSFDSRPPLAKTNATKQSPHPARLIQMSENTPTLEELTNGKKARIVVNVRSSCGKLKSVNIARMQISELSLLLTELRASATALKGKLEAMRNAGIFREDQRVFRMFKARDATLSAISQVESVMQSVKFLTKQRNREEAAERRKLNAERKKKKRPEVSDEEFFRYLKTFRFVVKDWFNEKTFADIEAEAARIRKEQDQEAARRRKYG